MKRGYLRMQNFNDVVNGTTDATKDFSIAGLTTVTGSSVTLNGNITLGASTAKTITYTGRVASNIDPSAAATYLLGSATLPWQSISLDRAATDGGAIYFDGGTTAFIKSDASHADLDLGGFTSLDLNAIALKGTGAIAPNATASVAIGTTALTYTGLFLDNDATDGGSINFNASSTSFLKASTDGATLTHGLLKNITYPATTSGGTSLIKWPTLSDTNAYTGILLTDGTDHRALLDFKINKAQSDSAPTSILRLGPANNVAIGGPSVANTLEVNETGTATDAAIVISKGNTSTVTQDFQAFFSSGDRGSLRGTISLVASVMTLVTSSDERLKYNINSYGGGLDIVKSLRPVTFNWKENKQPGFGFIAQEVEKVAPDAVSNPTGGYGEKHIYKGVSLTNMIPYIVSAIKELSDKIDNKIVAA